MERAEELCGHDGGWRSRVGDVELARAMVDAADDELDAAERGFAAAVDVFREYAMVWQEAEAWLRWGLALQGRGDGRAAEKLDAAAEIYDRHRAGPAWPERVARSRAAVG